MSREDRRKAVITLAEKGYVTLICNGNSMLPLFKPGDTLHIKKVDLSKLRVGDAVFCKVRSARQVHRIKAIEDRFQISNNHGLVNGWVGPWHIYGLCMRSENKVFVTEEELELR